MDSEIWKDIPGYEGSYQVSNLGRVKSLSYDKTGIEKLMKPQITNKGYYRIGFWANGKYKKIGVHVLVALAFIPNPEILPIVEHIDNNPLNCLVDNLKWGTKSSNTKYAFECGRMKSPSYWSGKFGKDNHLSIPILQFKMDGSFVREYAGQSEATRLTGITSINQVLKGSRHHAGGFVWKYKEAI